MFSCVTDAGEFSIARRGGAWYGEFDGEVFGPFETAAEAARYLAGGTARRLDDSPVPGLGLPAEIAAWRRGGRTRSRRRPAGALRHAGRAQ
jgi:hypothetical protein